MPDRRALTVIVAVAVVTLGAALVWWLGSRRGGAEDAADAPAGVSARPGSSLPEQCPGYRGPATRLTFPSADDDRHVLSGASTGAVDATVVTILRPGASSAICQWLPWADRIASGAGARVIVFDRRGVGPTGGEFDPAKEPADIAGAVSVARRDGAAKVALVGSSLGSTSVQSAAPGLDPAPCSTVLVSPVSAALTSLPPNTWITWETRGAAVDEVARTLVSRAADPATRHTLPVDSSQHSGGLIRSNPEVLEFLVDAVRSCTAPATAG